MSGSLTINLSLLFIILFIYDSCSYEAQPDYYWRDYTGIIPPDAIVGGQDINDLPIYIGEAYVRDEGVIVVEIFPGEKQVLAPIRGVKKINRNIKILCGSQRDFVWVPANASDLHLQPFIKDAVVGGHQDGFGVMHIGRISFEGETKIGKIVSFFATDANLHFVDGFDKEPAVRTYELLLYNNKKS